MVTSQGQVVTQAIPQGAIQIQNTQVSVRAQVCTQVHRPGGWTTITVCSLLGPLHNDSLNPHYSSKGCRCPQFTDRKLGVRKAYQLLGFPYLSGLHQRILHVLSLVPSQGHSVAQWDRVHTRGGGGRRSEVGLRPDINSVILDKSPDLSEPQSSYPQKGD